MKKSVIKQPENPEDSRQFVRKLLRDVRAMEKLLEDDAFETGIRRIGAEQEMFIVDEDFQPAPIALDLLKTLADDQFTTELGSFNIEYNLKPQVFGGTCLRKMEEELVSALTKAVSAATAHQSKIVLTGILPTLKPTDLTLENMTPYPRYHALNSALKERSGGQFSFQIEGADEFAIEHDNVMLEACNTSFQVHFQVAPSEFAHLYNITQVCTGPLMALAVNSPLLFGKRLWKETRIALFQHSVDTRSQGARGKMARVTFGSKWVDESVLEIFREDITRFRVLLKTEVDEDPFEAIKNGNAPKLAALMLHAGTVYRWNRACYGVSPSGQPHLRIENRIIPSGPTPLDEVANATFWFGLMVALSDEYKNIENVIHFDSAKSNFLNAARRGLDANITWVNGKSYAARDLIIDRLLPMARLGLRDRGIDADDSERYLDTIERRVRSRQTGSQWILNSFEKLKHRRTVSERLSIVTASIVEQQSELKPVHEWKLPAADASISWHSDYRLVSQVMTTDLFTVNEHELIELVASIMDWQNVQYVPVEDDHDNFVGLVNFQNILRHVLKHPGSNVPVSDTMDLNVPTIEKDSLTIDALRLMKDKSLSCLPVLSNGKLVGILTEEDFVSLARELLEERFTR